MSNITIAVVGLGNLGGSVAARLAGEGFRVSGFDPSPVAQTKAEAAGVTIVGSVAELVGDAELVFTSLPDNAAVRAAWLGADGVVQHAKPGTTLVELSTIDPQTMREVAAPALAASLRVLDCPVSGGPPEASRGELNLICAGDEEDIARVRPALAAIGNLLYAGPIGAGKTIKLVNNLMTNATVLLSAEAFQVGVAAGVDPNQLFALLSQLGGGRTPHFQKRFPWALADDFAPRFSIKLAEKDFRLGLQLAQAAGVPTPVASLAQSLYAAAMGEGLADKDIVGMLELYRRWTLPTAPNHPNA